MFPKPIQLLSGFCFGFTGGGLGGTRRGGPDVNIKHSGREDNDRERERYRLERERDDYRRDYRERERRDRRSRSPKIRERPRSRSRERKERKRRRSEYAYFSRLFAHRIVNNSEYIRIYREVDYDRRDSRRDREREKEKDKDKDKEKERKRSKRSRSRERKRDKRDKSRDKRDKERKERKPEYGEIKVKEEPIDDGLWKFLFKFSFLRRQTLSRQNTRIYVCRFVKFAILPMTTFLC